ncbi:F0F1 ATP synthase subunit delta [Devriesea agamarum]|uniref:F0F1 ATP synthase subunit delta n=1 Tax=Devriesea agamarum TaxID=472569 RepID=UPI00071E12B7|nr:F0F1 ATP synthase subunit delta [Devriesea agamarum]
MRGVSADSLHQVMSQADAVLSAPDTDLITCGRELFEIASLIDSTNRLLRLLSDSGRDGDLKASVAQKLLEGRVCPVALDLTLALVRRRWSQQDDLLDALECVGATCLLLKAEREDALGTVEDELFRVSRTIDSSPELSAAFDETRDRPEVRLSIVKSLLAGRAHEVTQLLVQQAVTYGTDRKASRRVLDMLAIAAERRQRLVALVTSATPLTTAQQERLGKILGGIYGREVHMSLELSPDVIGGLRIQVGNDLYDATVLSRLHTARRSLSS